MNSQEMLGCWVIVTAFFMTVVLIAGSIGGLAFWIYLFAGGLT